MRNQDQSDFQEYYKKFENFETLSHAEEKKILRKAQSGNQEAREKFINHNMRLVISCVMKFCGPNDGRVMSLISDGTLGLLRAIKGFDLSLGYKFSTYAVWWIDSFIRKGLKFFEKETVATMRNLKQDFKLAKKAIEDDVGYSPSDAEVAEFLGWGSGILKIFQKYNAKRTMIAHNVCDDLSSAVENPVLDAAASEYKDKIGKVLNRLTPIEEDIARRRYGVGCNEETLKEVAERYGKSRERIRQIETVALRKIFVLWRESDIPSKMLEDPEEEDEIEEPPDESEGSSE
jgi:RNA polymerase primary sigma factor